MAPGKPNLSITLPRNFQFHYSEDPPQTPAPVVEPEMHIPQAPPRFRVRRRRAPLPSTEQFHLFSSTSQDLPVPTIETLESDVSMPMARITPEPDSSYLVPTPTASRLMSPPKTPVLQTVNLGHEHSEDWSHVTNAARAEPIIRPSSSCSGISDSSMSSMDSSGSYASMGGSCTSPESEAADPFIFPPLKSELALPTSPSLPEPKQSVKRGRKHPKVKWTEEMDTHLWLTYLIYLQNPTLTPFKMLPGTVPPLGVCHRVAREAKKTWSSFKAMPSPTPAASQTPSDQPLGSDYMRSGSPDTIKPSRSGSNTPTAPAPSKSLPQWPRSESATRKRLRYLCKRKPNLSAHYQRLLATVTPSPYNSSSSHPRSTGISSPPPTATHQPSSFSTRALNVSLTTSTSVSMQPGNPLSRLASDTAPPQHTNDWFNQPVARASAHQKSQSLQLGLGITSWGPSSSHKRLNGLGIRQNGDDVFDSRTIGPIPPSSPPVRAHAPFRSLGRRLEPPAELHSPKALPRSFKRRAQHQLEEEVSPGGSGKRYGLLEELFGAPAETSHRRVRSRGFSLGDMGEGARRLSALFTPPVGPDESLTHSIQETPTVEQQNFLQPPASINPPRLASPFDERAAAAHFNTFPRSLGRPFENPTSFEERLLSSAFDRP